MSIARIEWGFVLAMEDDIRNIPRLADVLTTLGTGNDDLSKDGCYVLGVFLDGIGRRLNARFDALSDEAQRGRSCG